MVLVLRYIHHNWFKEDRPLPSVHTNTSGRGLTQKMVVSVQWVSCATTLIREEDKSNKKNYHERDLSL